MIKVHDLTWNYDEETDVTAVRITLEDDDLGFSGTLKGAAFCAPEDDPQMRVGIFEAVLDALSGQRADWLVAVLRHLVVEGDLSVYGDWEQEASERYAEDRALMDATLDKVGFKDVGGGLYMKVYPIDIPEVDLPPPVIGYPGL